MKEEKIRKRMQKAIENPVLCKCQLKYNREEYCFPVALCGELFMYANEVDFLIDGYMIRRVKDVARLKCVKGKYMEIARAEGVLSHIAPPDIRLDDWGTVFETLQKNGWNVIVEHETKKPKCSQAVFGRVVGVMKEMVLFQDFDGEGIWREEPVIIPFAAVTSVTIGSRYVETFSKYLPPCPKLRIRRRKK